MKSTPLIENVKTKILQQMKKKGLSSRQLALMTGLSEVGIRNWFSVRNYTPSLYAIEQVCVALEIFPYELFCDAEDIIPVSPQKRLLLEKYDDLSPTQQDLILAIIESYLE